MDRKETFPQPDVMLCGAALYKGLLDRQAQLALVEDLRQVVAQAPFIRPRMRSGRKMSVRMTAAGKVGWISDGGGYRYAPRHPTGVAWPPIPASLMALWGRMVGDARVPECCLINHYGKDARMGLHQDRDEADFTQPVLSVSLGDDGLFRIGGSQRSDATVSHWLGSGDVLILAGEARLAYHGVDRIRFGSSSLLRNGGRINLTLRVVT